MRREARHSHCRTDGQRQVRLAIRVARAVGGVVLNADSMQVYRDLRIITARPSPEEEASVEHRLFGHVDAAVNYSVGLWLADAAAAIRDVQASGRTPVLVGGTGMYFKALTQGLSDIPRVPEEVRAGCGARRKAWRRRRFTPGSLRAIR